MAGFRLTLVAAAVALGIDCAFAASVSITGPRPASQVAPVDVAAVDAIDLATGLPTPALVKALLHWLAAEEDLPPTDRLPAVEFVATARMIAMRYGVAEAPASDGNPPADVAAVYKDSTQTIYLPEGWAGRTAPELSLLVHELVHHVQNVARIEYDCPEAREKPAYAAQERWLILSGTDLATEFGIDPMTLLVRTRCFH